MPDPRREAPGRVIDASGNTGPPNPSRRDAAPAAHRTVEVRSALPETPAGASDPAGPARSTASRGVSDGVRRQRWSVRRHLHVTVWPVLVVLVAVAALGSAAVHRSTGLVRDAIAVQSARRVLAQAIADLDSADPRAAEPPAIVAPVARAVARLDRLPSLNVSLLDPVDIGDASAAIERFESAVARGESPLRLVALRSAALGRLTRLDSRLDREGSALIERANRVDAQVLAVLVALVLGAVVWAAWRSHALIAWVTAVSRGLGRVIRRFGDGDLSARAEVDDDEYATLARSFTHLAGVTATRLRRLSASAERGERLRMVAEALDLAADERDVYRVVERAFGVIAAARPAEIIIADGDGDLRPAAANPFAGSPACSVRRSSECVVMRRGRPAVFDDSTQASACPMLADRGNRCSAVCVPVTLSGRSVGVVHVTGAPHEPPPAEVVDELLALAGQVGGRVDAIRTLESTIRQARTDVLTGLPNRRAFEQRASDLLGRGTPFVLVVADLDRFKAMNDTYGHEFGDRALQLFAEVVQGNARPQDTVARFGGEEFVFAYPEISIRQSVEVIERLRTRLADAIARAEFPPFTCSFGVCHSSAGDTVDGLVRIADAGLMMAKENGRDRVVIADRDLAAEVFH